MLKPKLMAGFTHWKDLYTAEKYAKANTSLEQRLGAQVLALTKELDMTKARLEIAGGNDMRLAKEMEEKLAAEKEKRIAHTQEMAVRRIGKRDLTMGWMTWLDMHMEERRRRNLLRAAGARLAKPKVFASLRCWRESWEARQAAIKLQTAEGRMQEEIRVLTEQLTSARQAMADGRGMEAERERFLAEQLEREKEKRIEHTKQMAVRRIAKRDLARGWSAWVEPYLEKKRRLRMLAAAGARMRKPKVTASFSHWKHDWEGEVHVRATMSIADQLRLRTKETHALQAQLQGARDELDSARQAMMEGRGLEAELQRQMEEQLEREKEKRIEHTKEMAVRRIARRDLARGWVGWLEPYLEEKRRNNLLKAASARLTKPKVISSFTHWKHDWEDETHAKATMSITQLYHEEQKEHKLAKDTIAKLTRHLDQARQAMAEGRGQEAELQRQMEERLEREREKRIEHTKEMAIRRIGKRELTRGWVAWVEPYLEKKRKERALKAAGARMLKPKLMTGFSIWKEGYRATKYAAANMTLEQRLTSQVVDLRDQLEEARKEIRNAKEQGFGGGLTEKEVEMQIAARLAEEKAKRIERTQAMALKRIGHRDLARGWVAWYDTWEEIAQQNRVLKAAGAKLTKPKVVAVFHHWRRDWEHAEHQKTNMSMQERLAQEQQDRKAFMQRMAEENSGLREQIEEMRQAALEGRGLEAEMQRQLEDRLEREKEKRIAHTQEMALRRICRRDLTRGWTAWLDEYLDVKRTQRLLQSAGNKLMKPKLTAAYGRWHKDWESEELEKFKMGTMTVEERLREQLVAAKDEIQQMKRQMSGTEDVEAEMQRLMEEKLAIEKEKRIEHTKEMAVRRIARRDLARGWTGWLEPYLEQKRRMNLLKAAGARLAKPKLVAGFSHWHTDWSHEQQLAKRRELEAKASRASTAAEGIAAELERAKRELEDLRRQMGVETGPSEAELALMAEFEAKMAAEKEKRIAHTQDMAVKRIMKRDLTRGWLGWLEPYLEEKRRRNLLRAAASRLTKPKLVASFKKWNVEWETEEHAKAQRMLQMKAGRAARDAERNGSELEKALRELEELRAATRDGRGLELENERSLKAQIEAEREKRIEHTKDMAVQRIMKRDLARGWVAWHSLWYEDARIKRMLRATSARLLRPKVVCAVKHWRDAWERETTLKQSMTFAQQLEEQQKETNAAWAELQKTKDELERARRAMIEGRGAEEEQQRLMEERLEREREKRIEHTKDMAVRRIAKRDLSRGFLSWAEPYLERQRRMRLLAAAGARLAKPKMVQGWSHWKRDWEFEVQGAALKKAKMAKMSIDERFALVGKEKEDLAVKLQKTYRELHDQKELDAVALKDARKAFEDLQKQLDTVAKEKAGEKASAIMAKAETDQAQKQIGQRDEVVKQAQELLKEQQDQASKHLEEQLAQARRSLEKELKAAHNTIEELREEVARLQADKIRGQQLAHIELHRPTSASAQSEEKSATKKKQAAAVGILGHVDFDESRPLGEQLKECLGKHAIRVLDLFREWDSNGDGEISRKEFRQAMPKLGMHLPDDVVNSIFDQYDPDGSGKMDFKELQKMLKGGPPRGGPVKALAAKPGSADKKPKNKWAAAAADVTDSTADPAAATALKLFGKK